MIAEHAKQGGGRAYSLTVPSEWKTPAPKPARPSTPNSKHPIRKQMAAKHHKLFIEIGRRDGFHCQRCASTFNLEIDHITPVSKGGNNDLSNLQLLCSNCNAAKRDKEVG
jgi:5-methylcytosine-specific restriction endonuclease McrA